MFWQAAGRPWCGSILLSAKWVMGASNGYARLTLDASTATGAPIEFHINSLVPERPFPEGRWCKLLRVRSQRLSAFHGRDVFVQAAIIPPASYYDQPDRRYPALFTIPGFGGTHLHGAARQQGATGQPVIENNPGGVEFLRVMLDPSCPLGHHVFADSANNGPVGTALVEEFLPEFDQQFRSSFRPPRAVPYRALVWRLEQSVASSNAPRHLQRSLEHRP
jgi:hypothetical protein